MLDHVERPDGHRHEVGRERLGLGEAHLLHPGDLARARHGGVADRLVIGLHAQRHVEGRLEARLVEAREGQPGARRLELREGVGLAARVDAVEPLELSVEGRVVGEADRHLARPDALVEAERGDAAVVDLLEAPSHRLGALGQDLGLAHVHVLAVHPDHAARLVEAGADVDPAREAIPAGHDLEVDRVVERSDALGQATERDALVGRGVRRLVTATAAALGGGVLVVMTGAARAREGEGAEESESIAHGARIAGSYGEGAARVSSRRCDAF